MRKNQSSFGRMQHQRMLYHNRRSLINIVFHKAYCDISFRLGGRTSFQCFIGRLHPLSPVAIKVTGNSHILRTIIVDPAWNQTLAAGTAVRGLPDSAILLYTIFFLSIIGNVAAETSSFSSAAVPNSYCLWRGWTAAAKRKRTPCAH
jgi:hypothetical protein